MRIGATTTFNPDGTVQTSWEQVETIWHDLRKDPEDLPAEHEEVLVYKDLQESERGYFYAFDQVINGHWIMKNAPIAWARFEKFEGGVKEWN